MHGRKRLPPGQVDEAKRQATLRKIEKYIGLRDSVLHKRREGVLDAEALDLTTAALAINADFYTLWNYRRDILNALFASKSETEVHDACVAELKLLELAIAENPKSYCLWTHRLWVVDRGKCSLAHELDLCRKFLDADERNFHCWGYRRAVATRAGETMKQAVALTTAKINQNFSNYSAWHYRSKWLPRLLAQAASATCSDATAPLTGQVLDDELGYIEQALYTEPDDQSAWLYYRWLLAQSCASAALRITGWCPPSDLVVSEQPPALAVVLSHPVKIDADQPFATVTADGVAVNTEWTPVPATASASRIYMVSDTRSLRGAARVTLILAADTSQSVSYSVAEERAERRRLLEREQARIDQLLELEPECRFGLLTRAWIARELDGLAGGDGQPSVQSKGACDDLVAVMERLAAVDPLRANYYSDMVSVYKLELLISTTQATSTGAIDLARHGLTRLVPMDALVWVRELDLSDNPLRTMEGLEPLCMLEQLRLDRCQLSHVRALASIKPRLSFLSLRANRISDSRGLAQLPSLADLDLSDNPVAVASSGADAWGSLAASLKASLPALHTLNGLSLFS